MIWKFGKLNLYKFVLLTPLLSLIFGATLSEDFPGFALHAFFALLASASSGYFLYLFLNTTDIPELTDNKNYKKLVNQSLKIGLALFILVTIAFGQRFDYRSYTLQWDIVSKGLNPWGIDLLPGPSANAYGPIHNIFFLFNDINPILPKIIFVGFLIFSIYLISFGELNFQQDISLTQKKSLFILTIFSPIVVILGPNYGVNDCFVTSLMIIAVYIKYSQKFKSSSLISGLIIAIAGMTKLYPFILGLAFIFRKGKADINFLASLLISTLLISFVSFRIWGMSSFTAFFFNSGRPGGGISLYNYIDRIIPSINMIDYNTIFVIITSLLCLLMIYIYQVDLLPGSILLLASALTVYKLGHVQFFLYFICVIPLLVRYLHASEVKLTKSTILSFVMWLAFLNFYQILYNSSGGMWNGDSQFFRDLIAPLLYAFFTLHMFLKLIYTLKLNKTLLSRLN